MSDDQACWIFIRDGQRSILWATCCDWDRYIVLSLLSQDPRNMEQLEKAWDQEESLTSFCTIPWRSEQPANFLLNHLYIDLEHQIYAWYEDGNSSVESGGYQESDEAQDREVPIVWVNVPTWWESIEIQSWPPQSERLTPRGCGFDFRRVLYGHELSEFVATKAIDACEELVALSGLDDSSEEPEGDTRDAVLKRIHAEWLMTPRDDLNHECPRFYLHHHRQWKCRELDLRRTRWSRSRKPCTEIDTATLLYRNGPFGMEEIVSYFDLCRELVHLACNWVVDEPAISQAALTAMIENAKNSHLHSEAPEGEGDGKTVQEIIDMERRLMPRLASSDPIDCDCPLCRLGQLQPEMFGPSFVLVDGYHLELEDEFAFSICEDYDEWQSTRDEWICVEDSSEDDDVTMSSESDDDEDTKVEESNEWSSVWNSAVSFPQPNGPTASLLALSSRLTELISNLLSLDTTESQESIRELNDCFDALNGAVRQWLLQAVAEQIDESSGMAVEMAIDSLTEAVERVSLRYPAYVSHCADLQSLIHQWHRSLSMKRV